MRQANRREARLANRFEIPAAPFDIQDVFFPSAHHPLADLYRCISAAVQDERVIAAEELRGINAQAQLSAILRRVGIIPERFHWLSDSGA